MKVYSNVGVNVNNINEGQSMIRHACVNDYCGASISLSGWINLAA